MIEYVLGIGDFSISIKSKNIQIHLDEIWNQYLVAKPLHSNIHIDIQLFDRNLFVNSILVFQGNDFSNDGKLWEIFQEKDQYYFFPKDQSKIGCFNFSLTSPEWKIFLNADQNSIMPMEYPVGSIVLLYASLLHGAVMMHSSAIISDDFAYVFSGVSGIGKSTMARIWNENGYKIINDDRLIISPQAKVCYVYNSPMLYYSDVPKKAKLKAIFLLKQASKNSIRRLEKFEAISRIIANTIQQNFDKEIVARIFKIAKQITSLTPVYELGFFPDSKIIPFIHDSIIQSDAEK